MNKPYTLYCDASDSCIGACLGIYVVNNNEKSIYFLSHRLSKTQQKWLVIEKEAFAIHYALQKLDHYLHGAEFIIKTDHKPLKYLLESPMQNKKVQLWALGISGYNCKIEYISGAQNTCADLLSRSPPYAENQEDDGEIEVDVNPLLHGKASITILVSCNFLYLDPYQFTHIIIPVYILLIAAGIQQYRGNRF